MISKRVLMSGGLFLALTGSAFAQYTVSDLGSTSTTKLLKFSMQGYSLNDVKIGDVTGKTIALPGAAWGMKAGLPMVPHIAERLSISDNDEMAATVTDAKYTEIDGVMLAPSKGAISRNKNPNDVPYSFGPTYSIDAWFPVSEAALGDPFIAADLRGQVLNFYPFLYNPAQKKLRVYSEITVSVAPTGKTGKNVLHRRASAEPTHYSAVSSVGSMLIFCTSDMVATMQPLADWKNRRGLKTQIINVGTKGDTSAIKKMIADSFATGLKYVLLVGDQTKVPPLLVSYNDGTQEVAISDSRYCLVSGNDEYYDLDIGRFCGTTTAQIETQVDRTLYYEQKLSSSDTWLAKSVTGASNDPTSYDYPCDAAFADQYFVPTLQHFGYNVRRMYDGGYLNSDVGNAATYTAKFDTGFGVLAYSGHGDTDQLYSARFTTAEVANLTNVNRLPMIFALACCCGTFNSPYTCLGTALLTQTYNGQPVGAIGCMMASISQPWDPPYPGVSEMTHLATDSCPGNVQHTLGGICTNGALKTIDLYGTNGTSQQQGYTYVADAWICFGDPSLNIMNKVPSPITITYPPTSGLTGTVTINGTEGATVCLYSKLNGYQQVDTISGGSVTFTLNLTQDDSVYVTATKYETQTFMGSLYATKNSPIFIKAASVGTGLRVIDGSRNSRVISLTLAKDSPVSIDILNMSGRVVSSLYSGSTHNGHLDAVWNTSGLSGGVYVCRVKIGSEIMTQKISLLD